MDYLEFICLFPNKFFIGALFIKKYVSSVGKSNMSLERRFPSSNFIIFKRFNSIDLDFALDNRGALLNPFYQILKFW